MNRREMIRAVGAGAAALALAEGQATAEAGDDLEAWKSIKASKGPRAALRKLPTTVRPIVDPADVMVPEGYELEPLVVGLSFPTCMEFGDDGTLYIGEGGSTWPTRPALPPRILSLSPDGKLGVLGVESFGGPRGMAYKDGTLYVMAKGGYLTRLVKFDTKTGKRTILIEKFPDGGWHEPGGPVISPRDGLLYFAQGSVSLYGAVDPEGFTVDIAKHPKAHDVPGQDVTLTGNNVWSRNPTRSFPYYAETGPFKPYGVPSKKGEVIKGEKFCNSAVWRSKLDGSDVELLAWGIRNPFGMAFDEAGELYVSDNDFEEKGDRAIGEDPDRIWHIKNATTPHGSVTTPDWYGFPDIAGDGLPVWHEKHRPNRGQPAQPFLQDPPKWAGPAAVLIPPHTCECRMDFCRSDAFGHRGDLFLAQFGTYAPLNTSREEALNRGFQVARVDVKAGTVAPFLRNVKPGPASYHPGAGGLERPVDCKFSPDGKSLYVLDFGVNKAMRETVTVFGHTGVLWRLTKKGVA